MDNSTLYLIDGHSLTFKAYYAIRGLTSPSGQSTGAVYGFLRMLLKYFDEWQPQWFAVVFDTGKPTFRSELYPQYKANREAPPEDFGQQMEWIYRLLRAMGIAVFDKVGYEADDLLATMAHAMSTEGNKAVVVSADKDLFQLVNDRVTILRPGLNEVERVDAAGVEARLGVRPDQVADWLALVGDSSDNIPGVPGIGPKTARTLLGEYRTLEALIEHAGELKRPRQRQAIEENADRARLARQLATVVRDVDFEWSLEDCRMPENLWTEPTVALMAELGFDSLLKERNIQLPQAPPSVVRDETTVVDYQTMRDEKALGDWLETACRAPWLAIDTETTSTDAMRAELVGISMCHEPGQAIYIPVGHRPERAGGGQIAPERLRLMLDPVLCGESGPRLVAHNAKYDWKILRRAGFKVAASGYCDTMIASYLLDPDKAGGHGLKALGSELCGVEMKPIRDLIGSGRNAITMAEVDVDEASDYACRDADVTLRLHRVLSERLDGEPKLCHLRDTLEMPLVEVLIDMEMGGFKVDVDSLRRMDGDLNRWTQELAEKIWTEAGHPFNIGSPKQVAQVLYGDLGLPPGRKGKSGDYSTNEYEMERLSPLHPIARLILEYRGYEKLRSTYIDALPRLVHPRTGRIHSSFNQTIAATGRLSSADPNLQNIPIRTEVGRTIRRAFVADNAQHQLIKADYSQIELRILAHMSRDASLCQAYEEGRDIHRQTAAEVFEVTPEDVTKQMRSQAKVINFGIIYGMSAHGLSRQLGLNRTEAGRFIERYFATYPGVREWIDRLLEQARRDGWVETLMGRRRLAPDLTARNKQVREGAERIAVNTPIQGTCADMIKAAMIRIHRQLHSVSAEARMVCQVHDELVFTAPVAEVDAVGDFVREAMVEALPLSVPVVVDVSHALNWAEC